MNYYERAVEIAFSTDLKELVARILASNPGAIVRSVDGKVKRLTAIERECLDLYRSGQQVEAIKRYRNETGASLTDAKEAVEGLAGVQRGG